MRAYESEFAKQLSEHKNGRAALQAFLIARRASVKLTLQSGRVFLVTLQDLKGKK